jgi:PTS system nitrogen regulatory IIA component
MPVRTKEMSIQHCFGPGSVVSDLAGSNKYDAIRDLIRRAPILGEIEDRHAFEEAFITRERLHSTGLGHGVAVAHGRTPAVARVLIALGLSRDGIPFESPDGDPVQLLFLIASPPGMTLDYLQALSTLVRCVRPQSLRESLFSAGNVAMVESRMREALRGGAERGEGCFPRPSAGGTAC